MPDVPDTREQVADPGSAFQIVTMLQGVVERGTGKVVRVDGQGRRAVEFDSITELDRRRLIRFIFECQRAERQRGLEPDGRNGN